MSFGSLSGNAIAALNAGAALAGCLHNTGEGGISRTTAQAANWCSRSARPTSAAATTSGRFDLDRLKALVAARRCGRWRSS